MRGSSGRVEKELRALFDNCPDILCVLDLEGSFRRINPAFEELLGFTESEVLPRSLLDFVHPDDDGLIRAQLRRVTRVNGITSFEARMKRVDGAYCWISWSLKPQIADNKIYATARDISARKRGEQKLRRQALAFRSLQEAVIITVIDGGIVDWNSAAEKMFGYSKNEVLGKSPSFLYTAADAQELNRSIFETLIEGGKWTGHIPFCRQDGSSGISETVIVSLFDERGQLVGTIGLYRESTAELPSA